MADASVDCLNADLAGLAAAFVLPGLGPDVDQAVRVACELLARDLDTPATTAVACLPWGSTLRDAAPGIRDMLREQGFPAPGPEGGQAEEFTAVLRAVALGGMPVGAFFSVFIGLVPAWDQQNELQRRLMVALNDWDGEMTPAGQSAAAAAVRQVAREAVGEPGCPGRICR